jgi:hypothetical protein
LLRPVLTYGARMAATEVLRGYLNALS